MDVAGLAFVAGDVESGRKRMTKPLGVRGRKRFEFQEDGGGGATLGKAGTTGLRTSDSSGHCPRPTLPSPRCSTALAQDELSYFDPGAHQKIPARGQQPAAQRLRGRWWENSPEEEAQALLSDMESWG